jgi:hypothetical protein
VRDPIEPNKFLAGMRMALNESSTLPSITMAVGKSLAREPNLYHVRQVGGTLEPPEPFKIDAKQGSKPRGARDGEDPVRANDHGGIGR